ncbi:hypothetical protein AHMF7605_21115 [Adhaeribacter arboris]|uniref:DUF922 domain-containing protein n=1 Tax=Adhaeribacter arboris TaxID=2072846 RepID=A0A2T2YK03_9BACT|nr:hypothetical protein [Adhaeribacter arboris]PSR55819.1 hypothetical protein AHMF7605_21115 [Adhaeribacter arboris]
MDPYNSYVLEQPQNIGPTLRNLAEKYLLKHEQTHFDITEFFAKKINEKLASKWFLNEQEASYIIEQATKENNKTHLLYDSLTNHGRDTVQQSKWSREYREKLKIN